MSGNVPRLTLGEAAFASLVTLATLPQHQFGPALVLGLIGLGVWKLRREPEIRNEIEELVERLPDTPALRPVRTGLKYLPLPKVGEPTIEPRPRLPEPERPRQLSSRKNVLLSLLSDEVERQTVEHQTAERQSAERQTAERQNAARQTAERQTTERQNAARQTAERQTAERPVTGATAELLRYATQKKRLERLPLVEVIKRLDDRDAYPHILILGPNGSGKTVLAQLLLTVRDGYFVILDPKRPRGWEPKKWGGLPYLSWDVDRGYQPFVDALKAINEEVQRRAREQENRRRPFPTLTVVIDEARAVIAERPEVGAEYAKILSFGREVGVRLIVVSTTKGAAKLGLSGEADSRESFTTIRLGKFAIQVLPELSAEENRFAQAAIFFEDWTAFRAEDALEALYALPPVSPYRVWSGIVPNCQTINDNEDSDFLTALLEIPPEEGEKNHKTTSEEVYLPQSLVISLSDAEKNNSEKSCFGSGINTSGEVKPLLADEVAAEAATLLGLSVKDFYVKLQEAEAIIRSGSSKTAAVKQVFGVRGGRTFSIISKALKATYD